jgi:uncharacterized protein
VSSKTIRHLTLPVCLLLLQGPTCGALAAQAAVVAQERAEYERWLGSANVSPTGAIAQARIGGGIRLGPADADVPLEGVPLQRVFEEGGRIVLESAAGERSLPKERPVGLSGYTLLASGPAGRATLSVFGKPALKRSPSYFPYDSSLVFTVSIERADQSGPGFVLAVDGTEVEAPVAGSVSFNFAGRPTRLVVRRIPEGTEESDLEIYFRDATNGKETYPAGRFVTLLPSPGGQYLLDFNRARNPFCAYSSVYACPAPWRGNTVAAPVQAGERYSGGGLEAPAVADSGVKTR